MSALIDRTAPPPAFEVPGLFVRVASTVEEVRRWVLDEDSSDESAWARRLRSATEICSRHTPCAVADGTRSVPATLGKMFAAACPRAELNSKVVEEAHP